MVGTRAGAIVCVILLLGSCGAEGDRDAATLQRETPQVRATSPDDASEDAEEDFSCERSRARPDVTLTAVDIKGGFEFDWKPGRIDVPAGEEVILEVVNRSYADHDFTAGSCYSGLIPTKRSITVAFTMPEGSVGFVCGLHSQSMSGKLRAT